MSKRILFGCIAVGVVLGLSACSSDPPDAADTGGSSGVETTTTFGPFGDPDSNGVFIAGRTIPAGTAYEAGGESGMIKFVTISPDLIPDDAVENLLELEGKVAVRDIPYSSPIVASDWE